MKILICALLLLLVAPKAWCQLATTPMQGSPVAGDTGTHTFAGTLFKGVTVTWNAGTAARYLMVFDGTAAPSNGTPTACNPTAATNPAKCMAYCIYVPSSTSAPAMFTLDFTSHPFPLRNGLTVALSTGAGCGTFTADTGTDWFWAN